MVFLTGKYHLGRVISPLRVAASTPPVSSFTPADLTPLAWFRLTNNVFVDNGTTLAVPGLSTGDAAALVQRWAAMNGQTGYLEQSGSPKPYYSVETGSPSLSGSGRILRVANGLTPITQLSAFSVSLWFKAPASATAGACIFGEASTAGVSTTSTFNLGKNLGVNNTFLRLLIQNNSNANVKTAVSTTVVFDDTWKHIVYTDNNGAVVVYINGVADATNFSYTRQTINMQQSGIMGVPRNATNAGLSSFSLGTHFGSNFVIDNKIWTQSDVTNLYNYGNGV